MGSYTAYVARRTAAIIPVLVGLSVLIFLLTRALPGDPALLALGPEAAKEQVEQLRREWGLDRPLYEQYIRFVSGIFVGQWGPSLRTRNDVFYDVARFFPATIELSTVAIVLAILIGVPLGVIAAVRKDEWEDHASRLFSLGGVALPSFWTGIMLMLILSSWLRLLPIAGRIDPDVRLTEMTRLYLIDSILSGNVKAIASSLSHIILPSFVLALPSIANIARLTRSMMIDQKAKDYIQTSLANGLPYSLVYYKYMLKNAFAPTLTMIALLYASSFAGAVLVEYVFAWPGIGRYLADSILMKDFNAISGVVMIVGLAIAVANLVADMFYGYLDPRIRFGEGG